MTTPTTPITLELSYLKIVQDAVEAYGSEHSEDLEGTLVARLDKVWTGEELHLNEKELTFLLDCLDNEVENQKCMLDVDMAEDEDASKEIVAGASKAMEAIGRGYMLISEF